MVKGRHLGQPFLSHRAGHLDHRLVLTLADDADLGAKVAHGLHLVGGHQLRQADDSPDTGLLYIPELDMGMLYDEIAPVDYQHLRRHYNTGYELSHETYSQRFTQAMLRHLPKSHLLAWDPVSQKPAWK